MDITLNDSRFMPCRLCAFQIDTTWGIDCILPNTVYNKRQQSRCDCKYPCDFAIDRDELILLLQARYDREMIYP